MNTNLLVDGQPLRIRISRGAEGLVHYEWARENSPLQAVEFDMVTISPGILSILLPDGSSIVAELDQMPQGDEIQLQGRRFRFEAYDPRSLTASRSAVEAHHGPVKIISPMPGRVVKILCAPGTEVAAKQGVMVIEAMKMQNELKAPRAGVLDSILVNEGESVAAGQALAVVK